MRRALRRQRAAQRLAEAPGQAIDILVTDVVMPGQSGPDLAVTLRARRPGLPVLFVSGHTDDAVVRHGLANHTIDFLPKPYVPSDLVRKVRDILDRDEARARAAEASPQSAD